MMNVDLTPRRILPAGLRLRSWPQLANNVVAVVRRDDVVYPIGIERTTGLITWIAVRTPDDKLGWVSTVYTEPIEDEEAAAPGQPAQFRFEVWPTEYKVITQDFGANPQNYRRFYGDDRGHQGIDIRAHRGTKIFSVAPGTVKMVYTPEDLKRKWHNFGHHVRVSHKDGYETIYAHLLELHVEVGNPVKAGTVLGLADNSGNSFGDHLHLHLKHNGRVINPKPFLLPLM
jgi:murein DD-endopeptidase MepM/ murein hydrolase activator NlpD